MNANVLDDIRKEASQRLDQSKRGALGQFMTPSSIAAFMASLFTYQKPISLLDAGAGVGSLTSAFLERAITAGTATHAETWEIDATLREYLQQTLSHYALKGKTANVSIETTVHPTDFIEQAVLNLGTQRGRRFTHAILNPPYKKMASHSLHRLLLRKIGIETVNLYTAFAALSIQLLENGGEMVAIIPRSFCNGPYYRPFRALLLNQGAIRQIHLFDSRSKAFADDDVLQENIIIHYVKGVDQGDVKITTSHDATFVNITETIHPFEAIVHPHDAEHFIRIPHSNAAPATSPLFALGLREIGLEVCTGPVVDFRVKEFWRADPGPDTVPLLYPHHLSEGTLTYPKTHKKPNALLRHPALDKWLMPNGHYVLVKRFSSKEERRRVVAYVVRPEDCCTDRLGFENHWNVFHTGKQGLDKDVAYGLATFLNSSILDAHFRAFSGHTQVNATDLRTMKYPDRTQLTRLGKLAQQTPNDQASIDQLIERIESA